MNRLLAGLLALFLAAPAVAVAQVNPSNVPANTVIGRIGVGGVSGPIESIPFATLATKLFGNTLNIQPPAGIIPGFIVTQNLSGSVTATQEYGYNAINVVTDTAACSSTCLAINDLIINHSFGGSSVLGGRTGIQVILTQTAATSASNTNPNYVASDSIAWTKSGDGGTNTGAGARGAYFGENPQARSEGAQNVYQLAGSEADIYGTASSSQKYVMAYSAGSLHVVQGTSLDAAFETHAGSAAPFGPGGGFHCGLCFAELGNTIPPLDSGATVLGTHIETMSNFPVTNGIDLRGFTISNLAFASTKFTVSGAGLVTIGATPNGISTLSLDVNNHANNASVGGPPTNTDVRIAGADGTPAQLAAQSFASANLFTLTRADGTAASRTGLVANDVIGNYAFAGWTSAAAYSSSAATIKGIATETWSGTANGARLEFATTPNTTAAIAVAMTIQNSGGVSVGTATDPGIGKIGALTAFNVGANQVVGARVTGYTAMTGTPDKATAFATSTVTLAQLAGRMMQLQADLTTHGLIGP